MSENLVPGFALLRALYAVVKGGDDSEWQLRAAVDAFVVRARDAEAEREFLCNLPESANGELVGALEGLEGACRGFYNALEIYVLEWPPAFPPPPDTLMAAVAAAVVSAEFRVACARVNIETNGGRS